MSKPWKEIEYTDNEDSTITFSHAGCQWTVCPDDHERVSADNDGSYTLDTSVIIEIDEENKTICIEI